MGKIFLSRRVYNASEWELHIPVSLYLALASLTRTSKNSYLQSELSWPSEFASNSTLVAMKILSIVESPTFLSGILQVSQKLVKSIQLIDGKDDLLA